MTIRNFEYEERGGEPEDVYYTLDLKEYIFITAAKKGDKTKTSGSAGVSMPKLAAARPSMREAPKAYTVKAGDSLWKIAARVYGNGDDWRKIYDKNKKTIGANPNLIKPGQKLVIPS
ncbi:LysM domain/BON superfamily protein [compost metagenome]